MRKIRESEQTKNLPVVIFTSSSEGKDLIERYNLGTNSYIRKPVDFDQISEATRELGLYQLVLHELAPNE